MFKARMGKVFIKPVEKTKQVGSILLADVAQKTVETGSVKFSEVEDLPVGKIVLYDKSLTIPIEVDGEELIVIDESDVWGIYD